MAIKFITGDRHIQFLNLCKRYDTFYWAVAWAGVPANLFAKNLSIVDGKILTGTILVGIDFDETDPAFLERYRDYESVRVIKGRNSIFHPKVYLFEKGARKAVLIGSSNLTSSGLGTTKNTANIEALILLTGKDADAIFSKIKKQIVSWFETGRSISNDDIARAKLQKINKEELKPLITGDVILGNWTWEQYVNELKKDRQIYHGTHNERLILLSKLKNIYLEISNSSEFSQVEKNYPDFRQALIPYKNPDTNNKLFGTFALVSNNAEVVYALGKIIINSISLNGEVRREDFLSVYKAIKDHLNKNTEIVALTSRLLAMYRPDVFVSVNDKSKKLLCKNLGIQQALVNNAEGYWDNIIIPIQNSKWYNSPIPNDPSEIDIWQNRVALLDQVCYVNS